MVNSPQAESCSLTIKSPAGALASSGTRSSVSEKMKVSESRYRGSSPSVLRLMDGRLSDHPRPKAPLPAPEL
jgi:hypothetical protein